MGRQNGPPRLPVRQLAILSACRFAEPIAITSIFPYLPEMIESFGVEKAGVAKWAGITSAVFSFSQCLTAIPWGRASDRYGRKPIILIGLTLTMLSSLLWGFSTKLWVAILSRAFSGSMNGNVGIIRTMVAEIVPEKQLQPFAFSVMPLVWTIGSIMGPSFGGFFAQPAVNMPGLFGNNRFFLKFPFALPNLIAALFFTISVTIGILFLQETLETKKHRPDYGLALGKKLVNCCKRKPKSHFRRNSEYDDDESADALLSAVSATSSSKPFDEEYPSAPAKPVLPPPGIREVFTRQSAINIIAYTFLALHSVSFDQLLPVQLHHPRQIPDSSNTHLPFQFGGGFGLGSGRIGSLFTLFGIVGCLIQFLIFPPVARYYGVLNCFKICSLTFPLVYFTTPYTSLIQDTGMQQVAMFGIMIIKSFCVIFAFPCSTIMLTNSALSLRVLATLNGFSTSLSAIGRGTGPALSGVLFTWGISHGYVITPWWFLGAVSIIGAVPVFFLVEMDGLNGNKPRAPDDSDSDLEHELPNGETGDDGDDEDDSAIITGDEPLLPGVDEEAIDTIEGPSVSKIRTGSSSRKLMTRSGSASSARRMRVNSPIGMRGGSVGPGRRFSNGLGQTDFGVGAGGTTFIGR